MKLLLYKKNIFYNKKFKIVVGVDSLLALTVNCLKMKKNRKRNEQRKGRNFSCRLIAINKKKKF